MKVPAFRFPTERLSPTQSLPTKITIRIQVVRRALQLWDLHLTDASQMRLVDLLGFIRTLHNATDAVKSDWDASAGLQYAMLPSPLLMHVEARATTRGAGTCKDKLSRRRHSRDR